MARYVVATVDEIPPGERKIVDIARRSVGVFNVNGTFYAVRNSCPHAGGPLCQGVTSGLVSSTRPGEYSYGRKGEILRCPWHGWEFDVTTGQSWFDPVKTRVSAYTATVETGVSLHESDQPLADAGLVKGPYTAEMYNVEIDQEYVVVHV